MNVTVALNLFVMGGPFCIYDFVDGDMMLTGWEAPSLPHNQIDAPADPTIGYSPYATTHVNFASSDSGDPGQIFRIDFSTSVTAWGVSFYGFEPNRGSIIAAYDALDYSLGTASAYSSGNSWLGFNLTRSSTNKSCISDDCKLL